MGILKLLNSKLCIVLLILPILNSCVARKKIAYFQDDTGSTISLNVKKTVLTIKPNDQLSIIVSAPEQDAVIPFNLPLVAVRSNNPSGLLNNTNQLQNYLVNTDGFIDFPTLGKIKVEGLLIEDLKEQLT